MINNEKLAHVYVTRSFMCIVICSNTQYVLPALVRCNFEVELFYFYFFPHHGLEFLIIHIVFRAYRHGENAILLYGLYLFILTIGLNLKHTKIVFTLVKILWCYFVFTNRCNNTVRWVLIIFKVDIVINHFLDCRVLVNSFLQ